MTIPTTITFNGRNVRFSNGAPFYPGETVLSGMGYLRLVKKGSEFLVRRFSGGGKWAYDCQLEQPGQYNFGPTYGHRVIQPNEEKDPNKRVLRVFEISVSRLRVCDELSVLDVTPYKRVVSGKNCLVCMQARTVDRWIYYYVQKVFVNKACNSSELHAAINEALNK